MTNSLSITWQILQEYISARDHDTAAHHLISELIDAGVEEDELWDMAKGNATLQKVLKEELGETEEFDYGEDE